MANIAKAVRADLAAMKAAASPAYESALRMAMEVMRQPLLYPLYETEGLDAVIRLLPHRCSWEIVNVEGSTTTRECRVCDGVSVEGDMYWTYGAA